MHGQRGVALAILLWFVAALSLLVAGIVASARTDTRLTFQHLERVRAEALGDGAIQLALAELLALQEAGIFMGRGVYRTVVSLGGRTVEVELLPAAGLVDLNIADTPILASLFMWAGSLDSAQAEELALRVVEWRQAPLDQLAGTDYLDAEMGEPRYGRFRVAEDLMLVLGVDRALFDRVEPLVYAGLGEAMFPDPQSAPLALLHALAPGLEAAMDSFIEQREAEPFMPLPLPPELAESVVGEGIVSSLRATATVGDSSQRWQRRRWVLWGQADNLLLWQFGRTEPVRAVTPNPGDRSARGA